MKKMERRIIEQELSGIEAFLSNPHDDSRVHVSSAEELANLIEWAKEQRNELAAKLSE